jgi:hypothetical protein
MKSLPGRDEKGGFGSLFFASQTDFPNGSSISWSTARQRLLNRLEERESAEMHIVRRFRPDEEIMVRWRKLTYW